MSIEAALQDPLELLVHLAQKYDGLLRAEDTLNERRLEIAQLIAELQALPLPAANGDSEPLQREIMQLQQTLAERERELESVRQSAADDAEMQGRIVALQGENAALGKQLEEKDKQLKTLTAELEELHAASPEIREARDYEAEINEFRRQLEADRQSLNQQIRQLQARNAELDETARQTELELSRERAQLARERIQLDRLRDEIRQEMERAQREAGVRERLAGIQRLKDELSDRRPDSNGSGQATKNSSSRWSGFLRRD